MDKERQTCEVYSRVCGYMRPVSDWNNAKQEEFKDRKTYEITKEQYERTT
jgi:anaerobic ribonucleoside-triphosphate reductase